MLENLRWYTFKWIKNHDSVNWIDGFFFLFLLFKVYTLSQSIHLLEKLVSLSLYFATNTRLLFRHAGIMRLKENENKYGSLKMHLKANQTACELIINRCIFVSLTIFVWLHLISVQCVLDLKIALTRTHFAIAQYNRIHKDRLFQSLASIVVVIFWKSVSSSSHAVLLQAAASSIVASKEIHR